MTPVTELNDPAALGELPATVHAERWLPLALLLPRCAAVLCHAGTGTTLAALTAGLPLVLAPQGADQFDNARACETAGVARVLMPDQVTATTVRNSVRAVLAPGSSERAAAQDMVACALDPQAATKELVAAADAAEFLAAGRGAHRVTAARLGPCDD